MDKSYEKIEKEISLLGKDLMNFHIMILHLNEKK